MNERQRISLYFYENELDQIQRAYAVHVLNGYNGSKQDFFRLLMGKGLIAIKSKKEE